MLLIGVLETDATEIVAVVCGTDAGFTHAGQDVLLNHNPALIADGGEGAGDGGEIDGAPPQLTS